LGPNKTGILGIFQPFSDAIKLFSKNLNFLRKAYEVYWNLSPIIIFLIFIIILIFLPIKIENNNIILNIIILIFILGLPLFPILWRRFFSFRKFSLIRSKRCISQILSYEIGIIIILVFIIPLTIKLNLENIILNIIFFFYQKLFIGVILFILILSETSRIPFDFIEGESELVSGFNIEYSSSYFSLFFIYEYGIILFFCLLISLIFYNFIFSFILILFFILIRSSFPRFRYDQMIIFIWKFFYSLIICNLILMKIY
jgi:NADH-ubiquinone oxidoreductase chain 1